MITATRIVHWPGKDTPACEKHANQLETLAIHMGFMVSSTACTDNQQVCKNCENELLKETQRFDR